MLLNCGVGEDSWESLGLQGDPTSPYQRLSVLSVLWKDWCWSWNSNTLATWCKELSPWKRPWCLERLKAGEGDGGGWDGWMASPTQWTWVWVSSGSWWWTGRPGLLQFMGLQKELNWTTFTFTFTWKESDRRPIPNIIQNGNMNSCVIGWSSSLLIEYEIKIKEWEMPSLFSLLFECLLCSPYSLLLSMIAFKLILKSFVIKINSEKVKT